MYFFSILFFLFIIISLLFYYLIPKKYQWICLLASSYIYYLYSGWKTVWMMILTTLTTWLGALLIDKLSQQKKTAIHNLQDKSKKSEIKKLFQKKKRIIFWCTLVFNFGILAFLKYFNFIVQQVSGVIKSVNGDFNSPQPLNLLLPLGISFYTFQAMSYLIDIYNEKYSANKNPFKFALFVSFFPQIIQGPIGRFDHLGIQFEKEHKFDWTLFKAGLFKMMWGFVKKFVIADISVGVVNNVFNNAQQKNGSEIVIGVLFYSLQQYADFSGGIDIVSGVAMLFGIEMAPNFKRPYFSISISDFWRRWHISLGAWMRDYLFYPIALSKPMSNFGKWCKKYLGKNAGRILPAAFANIVVFFVVGIWHGAQYHYIMWGLYNGIIIAVSDLSEPIYKKMRAFFHVNLNSFFYRCFEIIRTFIVVNIGWYFDRGNTLSDSIYMLGKTFTNFEMSSFNYHHILTLGLSGRMQFIVLIAFTIILFAVSVIQECNVNIFEWLNKRNFILQFFVYFAMFLVVLYVTGTLTVNVSGGFMYENF